MDYVYVCRSGENEELRYSLRSLEKNLPDVNVWLIGDAPSWYTGNIVRTKSVGQKYGVVRNSLKVLSETADISEDFILMNDDFFVMQPLEEVEVWHGGLLWDGWRSRSRLEPHSVYAQYLLETYKTIKHSGVKDPINYELHTPLPMTKTSLSEAIGQVGLWRSIVANKNFVGGKEHEDVKLYHKSSPLYRSREGLGNSLYISSDDGSFDVLKDKYLAELFSKPSRQER